MVILWVLLIAALLISCAADPPAATKAVASLLSALGTWPLWTVTTVRERAAQLIPHLVTLDILSGTTPHTTGTSAETALPPAAVGQERPAPGMGSDQPLSTGALALVLVSRLVYLCIASAIMVGILNLEWVRGPLVMLGIVGTNALVPPGVAVALLLTALPLLFGALLLESLDIIPTHAQLFALLAYVPAAKRFVDRAVRVACVLTIVMEVIVFLDSWLQLQQVHLLLLEGLLAAVTGLVVMLAGIASGWSLMLGIAALVALGLIVVWLGAAGLALLLRIVKDVLDLLADHVVPRLVPVLALPGRVLLRAFARLPLAHVLLRDPVLPAEAAHTAGQDGVEVGGGDLRALPSPALPPPPVAPPLSLKHAASLLGLEAALLSSILVALGRLGGKGALDVAGYASFTRRPVRGLSRLIVGLGGKDVSPSAQALAQARATAKDHKDQHEQVLLPLRLLSEALLASLPPKGTDDPLLVSCRLEDLLATISALVSLHARLPRQAIVLGVDTAEFLSLTDPRARTQLGAAHWLWAHHVIRACLLYDSRRSPLARALGHQLTLDLLGSTLGALLLAHRYPEQDITPMQAVERLCATHPFLSLAVGSAALLPGPALGRWDPGRWATRARPVGRGSREDTRQRLGEVLSWVQQEERCRALALPEEASLGNSLVVGLCPVHPRDARFAALTRDLERMVSDAEPTATSLLICGNGCADETVGARSFVQVAWLQGLALPASWQEDPADTFDAVLPTTTATTPPHPQREAEASDPMTTAAAPARVVDAAAPDNVTDLPEATTTRSAASPGAPDEATSTPSTTTSHHAGEMQRPADRPVGWPTDRPTEEDEVLPVSIGRKRGRPRGSSTRRPPVPARGSATNA